MKMTPAQQAAYTKAVVTESARELSRISSSYSTADRSRRKLSSTIAKTCKQQCVAPTFAAPTLWNSLPADITKADVTLTSFWQQWLVPVDSCRSLVQVNWYQRP